MEKKVHPTVIIDGYRDAQEQALKILDEIAIKVKPKDKETLKTGRQDDDVDEARERSQRLPLRDRRRRCPTGR